jgi:hypothetical protein
MATAKRPAPRAALELKTFVPAADFDLSKRFYRAVGFQEDWTNGEVAMFKSGATSFLLRFETDAGYAGGLQMQILSIRWTTGTNTSASRSSPSAWCRPRPCCAPGARAISC